MDWSEERYVRVYTRKTPEWMALCWQAKCVHALLLMECDRAGIVPVPMGERRVRMIAASMGIPSEVAEPGIADLLEDGRVVETPAGYVWPNFIAAQETAKSEKFRAKEYRTRKRAERAAAALGGSRVTKRDARVTKRDETVHPYRAVPSSSREEECAMASPERFLRAAGSAPEQAMAVVVCKKNETGKFSQTTTTPLPPRQHSAREQLVLDCWNEQRELRHEPLHTPRPGTLRYVEDMVDAATYIITKRVGDEDLDANLRRLFSQFFGRVMDSDGKDGQQPFHGRGKLKTVAKEGCWGGRLEDDWFTVTVEAERHPRPKMGGRK